MNERLMRAAPKLFAKFITAFEEDKEEPMSPVRSKARSDDEETPLWLVCNSHGAPTMERGHSDLCGHLMLCAVVYACKLTLCRWSGYAGYLSPRSLSLTC